jgi:hypothetical protein
VVQATTKERDTWHAKCGELKAKLESTAVNLQDATSDRDKLAGQIEDYVKQVCLIRSS